MDNFSEDFNEATQDAEVTSTTDDATELPAGVMDLRTAPVDDIPVETLAPQSTGFTSKDGKVIQVGDILSTGPDDQWRKGVIVKDGVFALDSDGDVLDVLTFERAATLYVVGNIYNQ